MSPFDALLGRVGTQGFQYHVEQERRAREIRTRIAEVRRQLEETGVTVIDPPDKYGWGSVALPVAMYVDPTAPAREDGSPARFTAATHAAACAFHAVFVDPDGIKPEYVCTNPVEAGHTRGLRTFSAPVGTTGANDTAPAPGLTPADIQANEEAEQRRIAEAERAKAERRESGGGRPAAGHLPGQHPFPSAVGADERRPGPAAPADDGPVGEPAARTLASTDRAGDLHGGSAITVGAEGRRAPPTFARRSTPSAAATASDRMRCGAPHGAPGGRSWPTTTTA